MSKEERLIIKFVRDTQEKKIKWETTRSSPSSLSGSEVLIDIPFKAKVKDKTLRIYKYNYKYWIDEDRFEWSEGFKLEFIEAYSEKSLYNFPDSSAISDLYDEVRRQIAGVDSFIDDYLDDEDQFQF